CFGHNIPSLLSTTAVLYVPLSTFNSIIYPWWIETLFSSHISKSLLLFRSFQFSQREKKENTLVLQLRFGSIGGSGFRQCLPKIQMLALRFNPTCGVVELM
ncbi:hypothetical protein H5410_012392, partial [Solanum commersonii]